MGADSALGVLSAGAGGSAVVATLQRILPREDLLVLSDAAYAPYARRSARVVADRVARLAVELQGAGVKAVLLASAAATSDALAAVEARVAVPVVGLEPVVPARVRGPIAFVVGDGSLRGLPSARTLRAGRGVSLVVDAWPGLALKAGQPSRCLRASPRSGRGASPPWCLPTSRPAPCGGRCKRRRAICRCTTPPRLSPAAFRHCCANAAFSRAAAAPAGCS